MIDDEGKHRLCEQRDPNEDEDQRRFGKDRNHDRAA
jgi:hypothetical protein